MNITQLILKVQLSNNRQQIHNIMKINHTLTISLQSLHIIQRNKQLQSLLIKKYKINKKSRKIKENKLKIIKKQKEFYFVDDGSFEMGGGVLVIEL